MEPIFAVLVGALFAGGVYLLLAGHPIRLILGLVLLGNAANLLLLTMGRLEHTALPLVTEGASAPLEPTANPLAQALVLTAIVIGLALALFALALASRRTVTRHAAPAAETGADGHQARGAGEAPTGASAVSAHPPRRGPTAGRRPARRRTRRRETSARDSARPETPGARSERAHCGSGAERRRSSQLNPPD